MNYGRIITSETYYEGVVTNTRKEMEVSVISSRDDLLKDIIESLGVLTNGDTHKINLEICIDNKGKYRLVKKWAV